MDIIKKPLIFLASLLLIACGSDSDNSPSAEVIFPEHLPKVNPSLSREDQSGIWMVYRVITSNYERTTNAEKTEFIERKVISHELTSISNDYDYYRVNDCTFSNFSPPPSLVFIDANENGYTELSRINENDDFGSSGRLDITYISNQKIYGKGWNNKLFLQDHSDASSREEVEFFAVKVSDEPSFILSDDLDFSGSLFSDSDGYSDIFDPACIAAQDDSYSIKVDGVETFSSHTQYFQQHGNNHLSFEIYNGSATNAIYDQVIGLRRHDPFQSIDHHCLNSEPECLASISSQVEVIQNGATGIAFTAKFFGIGDINNEIIIDSNISAEILPFEDVGSN